MKITLDQNLHRQMKELSRRKKKETGMTIGGFYAEALRRFIEAQKVPKKVERIIRKQFRFDVPAEMPEMIDACIMLARKRKVSVSVVIEEALSEYLSIPENYLGDRFYRGIKKEYFE